MSCISVNIMLIACRVVAAHVKVCMLVWRLLILARNSSAHCPNGLIFCTRVDIDVVHNCCESRELIFTLCGAARILVRASQIGWELCILCTFLGRKSPVYVQNGSIFARK